MKISDLKSGQGKVDIEVVVKSKEVPRIFNKYGRDLKVANAIVSDDSGDIKLSLWNDDADKVQPGQKLKITNGYVSEFNGEKQLTSGKFGKLEILDGSSPPAEDALAEAEQAETQPAKESPAEIPEEQSEKPKKEKKKAKIADDEMAM